MPIYHTGGDTNNTGLLSVTRWIEISRWPLMENAVKALWDAYCSRLLPIGFCKGIRGLRYLLLALTI
jgi:hypothetical protein